MRTVGLASREAETLVDDDVFTMLGCGKLVPIVGFDDGALHQVKPVDDGCVRC